MSEDFTDGNIYVDYSYMNNARDDLVAHTMSIAKTISSMEMELTALQRSWAGEDRDEYTRKQAKWDHAIKAMEDMLLKHSQLLDEISGSWKYNEKNLAQMWSEVRIG